MHDPGEGPMRALFSTFILGAGLLTSAVASATYSITSEALKPSSPMQGQDVAFAVSVNSTRPATGMIVSLELFNSSNREMLQQDFYAQDFLAGQTRNYSWNYKIPATWK